MRKADKARVSELERDILTLKGQVEKLTKGLDNLRKELEDKRVISIFYRSFLSPSYEYPINLPQLEEIQELILTELGLKVEVVHESSRRKLVPMRKDKGKGK